MIEKAIIPQQGALTPERAGDLIEIAIKQGHGPEAVATVKELVAVAKDLQEIQARNAFNQAFAQFKRDCPRIFKTKTGGDASDSGSKLSWKYAPIEEIASKVDKVLLPLGLSYGWSSEDREVAVVVTCTLRHVLGHSESACASIRKGSPNRAQTVGMTDEVAMSIGMRRSLSMVLGIVTEDVPAGGAPKPDDTPVSAQQAADLGALLEELESKDKGRKAKVLSWLKADAVEGVRASDYGRAVAMVQKALKALEAK